MSTKRERFSKNLRDLVAKSHRNQVELADLCGVSKGTFNDWVHGRNYPRPDKMERLAEALGVKEYELLRDRKSPGEDAETELEVVKLARELLEDQDDYVLFSAIKKLKKEEKEVIRKMILGME